MNHHPTKAWLCAAGIAAVTLRPAPLLACATCYGASDSPMAQGMNWGIFSLLGVILSVLACVVAFFVHVGRTSAKLRNGHQRPLPLEESP